MYLCISRGLHVGLAPGTYYYHSYVVKKKDFIPSIDQNNQEEESKAAPRGIEGVLLGYAVNPGGSWTGDFFAAPLKHFEAGDCKIRIYRTKTVVWPAGMPIFPLYEAEVQHKLLRLKSIPDYKKHKPIINIKENCF